MKVDLANQASIQALSNQLRELFGPLGYCLIAVDDGTLGPVAAVCIGNRRAAKLKEFMQSAMDVLDNAPTHVEPGEKQGGE